LLPKTPKPLNGRIIVNFLFEILIKIMIKDPVVVS